jgi:hypothetical protein
MMPETWKRHWKLSGEGCKFDQEERLNIDLTSLLQKRPVAGYSALPQAGSQEEKASGRTSGRRRKFVFALQFTRAADRR